MKAPDFLTSGPAALTLIPLLGLAVDAGTQLVLSRLPLSFGPVRRQFVSFGCGLIFTVALLALGLSKSQGISLDAAGYFGLHVLSYVFLGFGFFNFINMNVSSLRIRMLKEYLRQDPAPLSDAVLMEKYNVRSMLDARLGRLEAGGQIRRANERFFPQLGAVTAIGWILATLRRVLLRT